MKMTYILVEIYIYIRIHIIMYIYMIAVRQPLRRELGGAAERRGLLLQQVQAGGGTMGGQSAPLADGGFTLW